MPRFLSPLRILLLCLASSMASTAAGAYPEKPVKIVVPAPAGGTNDIVGRIVAQGLSEAFGQNFYVENRAGGGGTIGVKSVAGAEPDGYTLLVSFSGPVAVGLELLDNVPYDVKNDFAPIATLTEVQSALVARPDFPQGSLREIIDQYRTPGSQLKISVSSLGSMHHLIPESLVQTQRLDADLIPYKGAALSLVDLAAGHTDIGFENLPALQPYINTGRLKPLAVTTRQRVALLPDTPTLTELGFPELTYSPWFILLAPAGVTPEIQSRLNQEVQRLLSSAPVIESLQAQGAFSIAAGIDESRLFLETEIDRWKTIAAPLKKNGQ